jgi:hypothetical protein
MKLIFASLIAAALTFAAISITGTVFRNFGQGIGLTGSPTLTSTGNTLCLDGYYINAPSGTPTITSDYNTFSCYSSTNFANINGTVYSYSQWKALGYDAHSTP